MSEWCFFSERKPVESDLPLVAVTNDGVALFQALEAGYAWKGWLCWRSIGPLPKAPVDEGERLADEYVEGRNIRHSGYEVAVYNAFLAGYAAGLKKGKG